MGAMGKKEKNILKNFLKNRHIFVKLDGQTGENSNFVPRMPFFSFEDNFLTRGLCPRVETVSEKENQGVQGTNITFSTKENSY